MTDSLIRAALSAASVAFVEPVAAKDSQMRAYHSAAYLEALAREDSEEGDDGAEYGLVDECARFACLKQLCALIAGASLQAARMLRDGHATVAANWAGGRHHARADEAAGFCWVNDAVLAILELTQRPETTTVLYVDVDIHHGDAVQDAFYASDEVAVVSLHRRAAGFFPGTGAEDEIGEGQGRGWTVNVPIRGPINDSVYSEAFRSVLDASRRAFDPDVVVLVLGTDGIAGDPLGCWGLSSTCLLDCAKHILAWHLPTLLLGGGGYSETTCARVHTACTAMAAGVNIGDSIPSDCEHFLKYGPSFTFSIPSDERMTAMCQTDIAQIHEMVDRIVTRLDHMATTTTTTSEPPPKKAMKSVHIFLSVNVPTKMSFWRVSSNWSRISSTDATVLLTITLSLRVGLCADRRTAQTCECDRVAGALDWWLWWLFF
jgi:histone deacetylase 8